MSVLFSVIIPTSHHRCRQLMLTLTSFAKQTYPSDQYEVIVVNDGSTDDTEECLRNYNAPYRFRYLGTDASRGSSAARNLGVEHATGEYIIFCDADFLVVPEFIQIHHDCHTANKHAVITGFPACLKNIYTVYYPDFSPAEKEAMRSTLQGTDLWDDSYLQSEHLIEIITPQDISNNYSRVYETCCKQGVFPQDQIDEFTKTDVAQWLLFVTRCVSLKKKYFEELGGFDERLIRFEDGEFGYRLLKKFRLHFIRIEQEIGFHQQHPASFRNRYTTTDEPYLKIIYENNGVEDPELSLLACWDVWNGDIKKYKDTLREIKQFQGKSQKHKDFAASLLEASRLSALNWI